jgi:lipoate-protein ligase A
MTLRVVDTGINSAHWNIAVTEAMWEAHCAGGVPDTLRFHRYSRAILLGCNQKPERELDVDLCLASGIEIAHRLTAGTAVYMDPVVLAWDFVADSHTFGMRIENAIGQASSAIAGGLARLGVSARAEGFGDILVGGRKVAGVAGYFEGPSMVLQGHILRDLDHRVMAGVLRKQSDTRKARQRVVSLRQLIGHVPVIEDVKSAVLTQIADQWDVAPVRCDFDASELALAAA